MKTRFRIKLIVINANLVLPSREEPIFAARTKSITVESNIKPPNLQSQLM